MDFTNSTEPEWPSRFGQIRKILGRTGPFSSADFQAGPENLNFIQHVCKILIIGSGGLGCELLKDLALYGFCNIHIIDMDTIDLSNLNRQFLFRYSDIGKPKATVAAEFINNRVPGCNVIPHFAKIQDFDSDFYRGQYQICDPKEENMIYTFLSQMGNCPQCGHFQTYPEFHIIVCGLDSIVARRWINGLLVSMLSYDDDGNLDQSSIIPLVDGGTEGFKGNVRVILPGLTACIECTLDFYPPQVNFPLCTIAHTPRLPEHCIEYVRLLLWPKENPFGENLAIDGDNPQHIQWILKKAVERGNEFNISGINYRLTQGVVKNIIPAVASTNAVIAALCATEVFKLAVSCYPPLNNYMNFNDNEGIYTHAFEAEKKDNCTVCSQIPQPLSFNHHDTLQMLVDFLQESKQYQLKSPGIITQVDGKTKTLYMSTVKSLELATKPNLKKTLKELELENGQLIYVADQTSPNNLTFKLVLS